MLDCGACQLVCVVVVQQQVVVVLVVAVVQSVVFLLEGPDAPQNVRLCEFLENARKKRLEKSFSLFFQNRTNADEFGRNPKDRAPLVSAVRFFLRTDSDELFFGIFQEFRKIRKTAEK